MKVEEIRKKITPVLARHKVKRAGLFGSAATGALRAESDIDILIDIKKDIGLFEFVSIKQELEEKLGRKVDLVEYQTLKPALREKILETEIGLL